MSHVTVKVKVPVTVGVPERTPPDESEIPLGKLPLVFANVYGLVLPPPHICVCQRCSFARLSALTDDRYSRAASEHDLVDLEGILRCRVARAGRNHQDVAGLIGRINIGLARLSAGCGIISSRAPRLVRNASLNVL